MAASVTFVRYVVSRIRCSLASRNSSRARRSGSVASGGSPSMATQNYLDASLPAAAQAVNL
jgi:hypothetical protein